MKGWAATSASSLKATTALHSGSGRPKFAHTCQGSTRSIPMYFLSVFSRGIALVERVPYADFAEAIAACGEYYEPRFGGSTLSFDSDVRGKKFLRAFASLTRPEDLDDKAIQIVRDMASRNSNAFLYSKSYRFLVESEAGVAECERLRAEEAAEDAQDDDGSR